MISLILNKNILYSFDAKKIIKIWNLDNSNCIKEIVTKYELGKSLLLSDDLIMISATESILLFNFKKYTIEYIQSVYNYPSCIYWRPIKLIDSNHIIVAIYN